MLKCYCDLCGQEIPSNSTSNQIKVTYQKMKIRIVSYKRLKQVDLCKICIRKILSEGEVEYE